jgi:hypothetical protein
LYFSIPGSDGERVAIGAEENVVEVPTRAMRAYYEYSGGSWSQLGADIDGESAGDLFGNAVSIDSLGSHVAIGAEEMMVEVPTRAMRAFMNTVVGVGLNLALI